jgi:uncharacterized protein (DUF2132 family)
VAWPFGRQVAVDRKSRTSEPGIVTSSSKFLNDGKTMNARDKLNAAYIAGTIIMASVVGLAFQSWLVFCCVVALGIYAAVQTKNIR